MECVSATEDSCNINEFEPCLPKAEISPNISTDTPSSLNSDSDVSNVSCGNLVFKDPFEGIFYRTHISESKLYINFVSSVFFDTFRQTIHSDYMSSVDVDETSFVSRCTTHNKGAKCSIKLDSYFKSVELSGIGFKISREERFPHIAQSLFKRLMQELDSRIEHSS